MGLSFYVHDIRALYHVDQRKIVHPCTLEMHESFTDGNLMSLLPNNFFVGF